MECKDFYLSEEANIKQLRILINQCWKLLPIYEGRNPDGQIVYSNKEATKNYLKNLDVLVTKVSGASKIWKENQYYYELYCILTGMLDFNENEHDRVKRMVYHCIGLIRKMTQEVLHVDEVL